VSDPAVRRAELPAGTDGPEVIRAVSAPLYYRLIISGEPIDVAAADRAAAALSGSSSRRHPGWPVC
jgi:hypothetical protein